MPCAETIVVARARLPPFASRRARSKSERASSEVRISYARLIHALRVATSSPSYTSGWYFFCSATKDSRTCRAEASSGTWRTSYASKMPSGKDASS